jgi:hypothetical protein
MQGEQAVSSTRNNQLQSLLTRGITKAKSINWWAMYLNEPVATYCLNKPQCHCTCINTYISQGLINYSRCHTERQFNPNLYFSVGSRHLNCTPTYSQSVHHWSQYGQHTFCYAYSYDTSTNYFILKTSFRTTKKCLTVTKFYTWIVIQQ